MKYLQKEATTIRVRIRVSKISSAPSKQKQSNTTSKDKSDDGGGFAEIEPNHKYHKNNLTSYNI